VLIIVFVQALSPAYDWCVAFRQPLIFKLWDALRFNGAGNHANQISPTIASPEFGRLPNDTDLRMHYAN
jgi:hypothetical protein